MSVEIKNFMEDCVKNMLDQVLKGFDICKCEKCKMDIMALALNTLPPKYVATDKGELFSKLSVLQQQFDVDIISAITRAATMVGESPRHDDGDAV